MKSRCYNPRAKHYWDYGGRGIEVCAYWRNSFASFYRWAKRSGYQIHLTIERKNPNGNYSPRNCKWANLQEQARNKRNTLGEKRVRIIKNRLILKHRICDIAKDFSVHPQTISRIKKLVNYADVVPDPVRDPIGHMYATEEDLPF
jgi:hypothetical protein